MTPTNAQTQNIILIGMPGAGKSTLGIVLAKIMNKSFIDADLIIQNQMDKTLQKIIDSLGPDGFIDVENQILSEITAENTVIATGGSAVYSDAAMNHLREIGTVVYLKASYETIEKRIRNFATRGIVIPEGQTFRDVYNERTALYEKYADITVDVDADKADIWDVVEAITAKLKD